MGVNFPLHDLTPNASSSSTNGRPVPKSWNTPASAKKRIAFFSAPHFGSDAGSIERASGLSCFSSEAQMQMKTKRSSSTMASVKPSEMISREVHGDGKEDYIHVRAHTAKQQTVSLAERVQREDQ